MQHLHQYLRSQFLGQFNDVLAFLLHQPIDGMFLNQTAVLQLSKRLIRGGVQGKKPSVACRRCSLESWIHSKF